MCNRYDSDWVNAGFRARNVTFSLGCNPCLEGPIVQAAKGRYERTMNLLLKIDGIDLKKRDSTGQLPIHHAASS